MSTIKKIINKVAMNKTSSNKAFIKYLKKNNVIVGDNTYFFSPKTTTIDVSNGKFISIGKNCKITQGVVILAHDFSYSVLRPVYDDIPKKAGTTTIGDNVFIGINSIILMGSNIGNNTIIGAGSVVSGVIPDNEVWGGNPAKCICTLDEYYKKCKKNFEKNAIITVKQFKNRLGRNPTIQELHYFSLLFLNNDPNINAIEEYRKMRLNGDNETDKINTCLKYKSKYNSYEEFIEHCNSIDK